MGDIGILGVLVHERALRLEAFPTEGAPVRIAESREHLAGSALNVASAFHALGQRARLVAAGGPGDAALLARTAPFLNGPTVVEGPVTPTATVLVSPGGISTVTFSTERAAPFERLRPEGPTVVFGFDLIADPEGFLGLLEACRRVGSPVILDAGPAAFRVDLLRPLLPRVDTLFLNRAEASSLTDGARPEEAVRLLPCREVHVKLGSEGSLARRGDVTAKQPGLAARAVDTTGAGDAYLAAALARRDDPLSEALAAANLWGARASTVFGAGVRLIAPLRGGVAPLPPSPPPA